MCHGLLLHPEHGTSTVRTHLSVFCADLRLEVGGETIAGLSAAAPQQWDMRPPELYFDQTKVLMGVGTIGLWGF